MIATDEHCITLKRRFAFWRETHSQCGSHTLMILTIDDQQSQRGRIGRICSPLTHACCIRLRPSLLLFSKHMGYADQMHHDEHTFMITFRSESLETCLTCTESQHKCVMSVEPTHLKLGVLTQRGGESGTTGELGNDREKSRTACACAVIP